MSLCTSAVFVIQNTKLEVFELSKSNMHLYKTAEKKRDKLNKTNFTKELFFDECQPSNRKKLFYMIVNCTLQIIK